VVNGRHHSKLAKKHALMEKQNGSVGGWTRGICSDNCNAVVNRQEK